MCFDRVQIVNQAGEKPEEWLLLESRSLLLMHIGENQNEDREDLRQVVDLGLVIVNTGSISMILDDVNNQPGHRIQGLERVVEVAVGNALDVAIHARFGANTEEERGHVFHLQDALLGQLSDEGDEVFLR